VGIVRASYALPRARVATAEVAQAWGLHVARGVDHRAVVSWDEDATTLAADAIAELAQAPLPASAGVLAELDAILAATGAPAAATLAEFLGAPEADAIDFTGGARAALHALAEGSRRARDGSRVLVVVSDVGDCEPGSREELARGAGAAAFLLERDGGATLALEAHATGETLFGRQEGTDVGGAASVAARIDPWRAPAAAVAWPTAPVQTPEGKPIEARATLRRNAGELGRAFLAELAEAFREAAPGQRLLVQAADDGGVSAAVFDVESQPTVFGSPHRTHPISYVRSLQERRKVGDWAGAAFGAATGGTAGASASGSEGGPAAPGGVPFRGVEPMGAFVSPGVYLDSIGARYRLEGRRCAKGHVVFPPKSRCAACGAETVGTAALAGEGTILAVTWISRGASPGEFAPEQAAVGEYAVALVQLGPAARLTARLTGLMKADATIGRAVWPYFRILYDQGGTRRYGLKFGPPRR
jgi:hydroxymethylglutaryl-CoA synthase